MYKLLRSLIFITVLSVTYISCSKSNDVAPPPTNPCSGVTVTVTGTVTGVTPGQSNGVIVASAAGTGTTYSLNGGAYQPAGTFSNLAAGTFTITAKNANGCTGSAQFTVGTIDPCTGVTVAVTAATTTATTGQSDGTITASATGGTGFTYSLNGAAFQATGVFTGLAAGVYTVTAKNSNGCTGAAQFTVTTTNPCTGVTITVTATVTNATTTQPNSGTITASAAGGTGFTFSKDGVNFQASGNFTGLAAGNYTITAKSSAGCTGFAQFTIGTTNPCTGINITFTSTVTSAVQCANPANGGIAVAAAGGTSPYTYSINSGSFQSSNLFTGLAATSYTITVKDANGCTGAANVTVNAAATGPLFNAVKQVLATNCALSGCHIGPTPQNGLDWTITCTIVDQKDRIKARAVDGNPSFMPPAPNPQLSAGDKQKIVDWINAGGNSNN